MAQVKQPLHQSHLQPPRRQGLENQDEHGRLLSVNSASCLWPQDALWLVPTYRRAGETGARPPISLERVAPSRQPSGHSLWRGSPPPPTRTPGGARRHGWRLRGLKDANASWRSRVEVSPPAAGPGEGLGLSCYGNRLCSLRTTALSFCPGGNLGAQPAVASSVPGQCCWRKELQAMRPGL